MTEAVSETAVQEISTTERAARRLRQRQAAEKRFRLYGMAAVGMAVFFLAMLFVSIVSKGYSAFLQTEIRLQVNLDAAAIDPSGTRDPADLARADWGGIVKQALRDAFPEVTNRRDKRALYGIVSTGASYELRELVMTNPDLIGQQVALWVPASDDVDMFTKGFIDRTIEEAHRRVSDKEIAWIDQLSAQDAVEKRFNWRFFVNGDSREPEMAGIWGAAVGSFYTLLITLLLAFPIGVMASVYLEEFAPKNRWTEIIEVNINNLAAVPSIVYGLLGLAVFLNFFGMPRSAPLVGGMVLALMTLPTIIIAGRAALKAVPPSIREAALGMGASRVQVVSHHVLPLAMPGILTGTIIGMAQALGETAPLLMIGMVAFIADIPGGPGDAATVLPVQIFLWADSPERAFVERTSAAILVLLAFLITMNLLAVVLRKRFERRW
jgi:phosphate transport system permease protein